MLNRPRVLSAVLLLTILLFSSPPAQAQEAKVIDEIVAVVGDKIILRSDVDGFVLSLLQQQQMPYDEELWGRALDQLVNQKVMAVVASRDTTIIVSDEQVSQALNSRIQQMISQVGGEARLEELYGKTVNQVRAELRPEFRERLLADQLQGRKVREIKITPSEVRHWFDQFPTDSLPTLPEMVRVAHIVRYPVLSPEAKADAREIIDIIRDSVTVGGAEFEAMARQFSDDPGSATAGGLIEDTKLGDLVPEFAAVAARAPIGEISQVFESPFGFHVLRVNDRRGDVVDFNHILIAIDDSRVDPTTAISLLETVRDSIVTHQMPFELMARRHSEEQFSSIQGGRVTDPRSGERDLFIEGLGPTWQTTLDTMAVGEISRPAEVELLDGKQAYHIVLLQRHQDPHQIDLTTDYARIEQLALQDKRARELEQWFTQLRERVYVEMRTDAADFSAANR